MKRRTLSLAAAALTVIVAVLAVVAGSRPAQASPAVSAASAAASGTVSVAIDTMNPPFARAGATVTLTGTVTNGTSQARTGLAVQLTTSAAVFGTRSQMDLYLTKGEGAFVTAAGRPFPIQGSLRAGATARWTASFRVNDVGITKFGVYPVAAGVSDLAGNTLASDRTLLPFWPGSQAAELLRPLNIAWIWPLIDEPHHQACSALTDNDLATSLGPGGRLSVLLDAAKAHPGARLTWFVDPALLSDVDTMRSQYTVQSKPNCTGAPREPASKAAAAWLAALRAVLGSALPQQTVMTPYANVDISALVHHGMGDDISSAFAAGGAVAHDVLHGTYRPSVAWPAGGTADLSVLTQLATREHIGTVVLNSGEMPLVPGPVYHGDDAVTSIRTGAGTPMNVLLADDGLTGVLRAGGAGSGGQAPGAEFAVKQRFLAETAMIAAESPHSYRSIVVAPPSDWNPTAALAGDLLSETVSAPWLQPAPLSDLTAAQDSGRTLPRRPPPDNRAGRSELGRGYLGKVSAVGAGLRVYKSMLYRAEPSYLRSLDEALAATESSAWRGRGQAEGAALRDSLGHYLTGAQKKVKIFPSSVSMGGASGEVPVSIQNGLSRQAVQVWVTASVETTPGRTSQLTVGPLSKPVTIQPMQAVTVRLRVSSAPLGPTRITLGLTSADHTPLPFSATQLTVVSTRYGRAILFLIGAAIGVLVLTSLYRIVRGWLRDGKHAVVHQGEQPGSVVSGTSGPRHPTEAPDDLADARRWADDA